MPAKVLTIERFYLTLYVSKPSIIKLNLIMQFFTKTHL